jgi:AcrR family transcriptional regulator
MQAPKTSNRAGARAERRESLLRAADDVIRRRGPDASMDEIAAAAGISKPILYRHFGDKGGLSRALIDRYVDVLLDRLRAALASETDPFARLARAVDTYFAFIEEHEDAYRFLTVRLAPERPEAQLAITDFAVRVAEEVAAEMEPEIEKAGLDIQAAGPWAHGIVGMVQLAGDWWMRNRGLPRSEVVAYVVGLLWNGLGVAARSETAREAV